jgi:hypothetical protein
LIGSGRLPAGASRRASLCLLAIEGFAVRVRFDPDRRTQPTVLTAVDGHERQLVLEVPDSRESGLPISHASDSGLVFHRTRLLAQWYPAMFNKTRCAMPQRS